MFSARLPWLTITCFPSLCIIVYYLECAALKPQKAKEQTNKPRAGIPRAATTIGLQPGLALGKMPSVAPPGVTCTAHLPA